MEEEKTIITSSTNNGKQSEALNLALITGGIYLAVQIVLRIICKFTYGGFLEFLFNLLNYGVYILVLLPPVIKKYSFKYGINFAIMGCVIRNPIINLLFVVIFNFGVIIHGYINIWWYLNFKAILTFLFQAAIYFGLVYLIGMFNDKKYGNQETDNENSDSTVIVEGSEINTSSESLSSLRSGIKLAEGEKAVAEIEAEFWSESSNPISRFFGAIGRFICIIFGFRKEGYLLITNKRIVEIAQKTKCYCFKTDKNVKYVLPASIKEVGYARKATCCCCCPVFYIYYEAFTQKTSIQVTTSEENVQKIVKSFYKAISQVQTTK